MLNSQRCVCPIARQELEYYKINQMNDRLCRITQKETTLGKSPLTSNDSGDDAIFSEI